MEYKWHRNPLHSGVVLDQRDKELLHARLLNEALSEHIFSLNRYLQPGQQQDVVKATRMASYDGWARGEHRIESRVEEQLNFAVEELAEGVHCGDCTCMPATCMKCHYEYLLGADTIGGVGKHGLYKIDGAYSGGRTPAQALQHLYDYEPKADWAGWEQHVPRWRAEAAQAAKWLRRYLQEHFPDEPLPPEPVEGAGG